jgi:hypothetical protein
MTTKPDLAAMKADPPARSASLMAAMDRLEAAIEAQTWPDGTTGQHSDRGPDCDGFVIFGSIPFLVP